MNRAETVELLRRRWRYTDQRFDDPTVDAWHDALETKDTTEVYAALIRAAREHSKITLHNIIDQLPRRPAETMVHHEREAGCTCGEARCELHIERAHRWIAQIRAQLTEQGTP